MPPAPNLRELESDRRGVPPHFAKTDSGEGLPDYYSSLYTNRLLRDIGLYIIPYGLGSDNIEASIIPEDSESRALVIQALSAEQGGHDLTHAVREFAKLVTQSIMREGNTRYEIVYWYEDSPTDGEPVAFSLEWLPRASLNWSSGSLIQQVSPEAAERFDFGKTRRLNGERIITFSLPDPLAGARRRMMDGLLVLGNSSALPPFARSALEEGELDDVSFDSEEYREKHVFAVGELTRPLGWALPSLFGEWQTDYHVAYRRLRFERSMAVLRRRLLDKLNDVLVRVGCELEFEVEIKLEGPLSVSGVEELMDELEQGDRSPSNIIDVLSYREP